MERLRCAVAATPRCCSSVACRILLLEPGHTLIAVSYRLRTRRQHEARRLSHRPGRPVAGAGSAGPVGGRGAGQGQLRGGQAAPGDRNRGTGPGRRPCRNRRVHARTHRPGPWRHGEDLRARRSAAVLQRELLEAADGSRPAAAGVLPVRSRHLHPAGRDQYRASGLPAHAGGGRQRGRARGAGQDRCGARRDPARTPSRPIRGARPWNARKSTPARSARSATRQARRPWKWK